MMYFQLARLRQAIITYTGNTFTGKGEPGSKNLIRHLSFMDQARMWGPSYVSEIISKAEKFFDFSGPYKGVYNQWYEEASEEIALNCIKIMEVYVKDFRGSYEKQNSTDHEKERLKHHITLSYNYLMKLKRLRMSKSTNELYLDLLSTICKTEHSLTGNNEILRQYEKKYEHYRHYVPHPLLERRRSTEK